MSLSLDRLNSSLQPLIFAKNKKELLECYQYAKKATESKNLSDLINKIHTALKENKNINSLQRLSKLEKGLRCLRDYHKIVSHSEKKLLTRLFIWIFPKSERAQKIMEQDKSTFQHSELLLHVVEGKEEKNRLEQFSLKIHLGTKKDPRKAFISSLIRNPSFQENAGIAITKLINPESDQKSALKDLHKMMLTLFQRHGGENIPKADLSDIYAAAIIASERYLSSYKMGQLVELAYTPMDLDPLSEENNALSQLLLVFATVDGEETRKIMDNTTPLSSYFLAKKTPFLKKMLSKAYNNIRKAKSDRHNQFILRLIDDKEFQEISKQVINDLTNPKRPIEERLQKIAEIMNAQEDKYLQPRKGEDRIEYHLDFYLAMWIAARDHVDAKALFGAQTLLAMRLKIEPTGKESNTQATMSTALTFVEEMSKSKWLERQE